MAADPAFALALAIVLAGLYLLVLRAVDANEKEPMWALGTLLLTGALAAALLPLVTGGELLALERPEGAAVVELARFAAIGLGLLVVEAISRLRGWSELNGLLDGLLYGAAAGLGFAAGEAFVRELSTPAAIVAVTGALGPLDTLWGSALAGLSEGLFGAAIGAGFGAAVTARSPAAAWALRLGGLGAAVLLHAGYAWLARADAVGGGGAQARAVLALALPLAAFAALALYDLARERRAIGARLRPELATGGVTEDELRRLGKPRARWAESARRLGSGDFDGWSRTRALRNRQVQIALVRERLARQGEGARAAELEAELERLRASAAGLRVP